MSECNKQFMASFGPIGLLAIGAMVAGVLLCSISRNYTPSVSRYGVWQQIGPKMHTAEECSSYLNKYSEEHGRANYSCYNTL